MLLLCLCWHYYYYYFPLKSIFISFYATYKHTNNVPRFVVKKNATRPSSSSSVQITNHTNKKINQREKQKNHHHCRSIRLWFIIVYNNDDDHHLDHDVDDDDDDYHFSWAFSLLFFSRIVFGYIINNNCGNVMWCEILFFFHYLKNYSHYHMRKMIYTHGITHRTRNNKWMNEWNEKKIQVKHKQQW